jgi:hypothetical protein
VIKVSGQEVYDAGVYQKWHLAFPETVRTKTRCMAMGLFPSLIRVEVDHLSADFPFSLTESLTVLRFYFDRPDLEVRFT